MNTLQSAIVFPIIFFIIASIFVAYCGIAVTAYFDQDDGVSFLLSALERSELTGYDRRVKLEEIQRLTGTDLFYDGHRSDFKIFKPSRILYAVLFGR